MTETISAPDTQAAASPQLPRPRTDALKVSGTAAAD